jgi:hypothetical protein
MKAPPPWYRLDGLKQVGVTRSFVKCSVDGCSRKLQPVLKVDA